MKILAAIAAEDCLISLNLDAMKHNLFQAVMLKPQVQCLGKLVYFTDTSSPYS